MSKRPRYKTIDLCAGIGGIRRGFEMTGRYVNVLSAEIDKYACQMYERLFGFDHFNLNQEKLEAMTFIDANFNHSASFELL